MARCTSAINLGWNTDLLTSPDSTPGIHTRCMLENNNHYEHEGKGLLAYQRIHWFTGDRRTYQTYKEVDAAWEI